MSSIGSIDSCSLRWVSPSSDGSAGRVVSVSGNVPEAVTSSG